MEAAVTRETSERIDLLNFDRAELATELSRSLELEPFRAKQLMQWMHSRRVKDFAEMTDISKPVRERLAEVYSIYRPKQESVQQSTDGTRKYLFELEDGNHVESVLIKQPKRFTLCISSQVGCALGCTFCRTAQMGLVRNLTTAEIVGQVLAVKDDAEELNLLEELGGLNNIVFMGMGEPLQNFDNVVRAVRILNDDFGHQISHRRITVSTVGLIPAIAKFGELDVPASLAISLNATTDEVRSEIMPINARWSIGELVETLKKFPLARRERLTVEYVLLKGVNDSDADLKRLPKLLHGLAVKVNLIPYNSGADLGYESPAKETILHWQQTLLSRSLNSSIRWSKGSDIDAACGQLVTNRVKKM